MARMYPIKEELKDVPYSEMKVYDTLSTLSDDFTIFHSIQWAKYWNKWRTTWRENDFLIFHKKLGAIVLEVKGGNIECHGNVFYQTNSVTGEKVKLNPKKRNDPLSQAIDGIYHYRKLIDDTIPDLSDRFPVEAAAWFTNCNVSNQIDEFPLKYREAEGAVLGNESFENGQESIISAFDFYNTRNKVDITDDEYETIIELIASDFDLIPVPSYCKDEMDYNFLRLTKEQTGLLDYIQEQKNASIQGAAGTGKTLIAKEAAKRFGLQNRKVLFLCFNRFLYMHLKQQYPLDNVTYLNIHTFISNYRPGIDISTIEKRSSVLKMISWSEFNFDDVVIDEGQDFVNDEIIYFKNYVELKGGHLFVFYDKNQLLTTDQVPEWMINSECKLLLTKNCRNTYEIALTSYNIIDLEIRERSMMLNGDKTEICFAGDSLLSELEHIINRYKKIGYDYTDIVILTLKSTESSSIANVDKIGNIRITNDRRDSSVLFTTASKFKGLESRVVIIIDIDDYNFINEEQKRNFYVACSRATHKLTLCISGDGNDLKKIAVAIDPTSHYAAMGVIAMKTQAQII